MLIPIFTSEGQTIGLFKLKLYEQIAVRYLQNVLSFGKGIGNILSKIYKIKSRVMYYEKDSRTLNEICKKIFMKYSEIQNFIDIKVKLDEIFRQIEMENMQIIFLDKDIV